MITLNADMGESFGIHSFGHDDELVKLIDIANIACGFHAGDPGSMRRTIALCAQAGVAVGAHPGLPDLVGFGRREMRLEPDEVTDLVRYQVGALMSFIQDAGLALNHIKPHGALYGMTARDASLMRGVCNVAQQFEVPVLGLPGTQHEKVAAEYGLRFVAEFYVDLEYADDGSLLIERRPHTTPPDVAAQRARRILARNEVVTRSGRALTTRADTICVHADASNAVEVALAVRDVLSEAHQTS
jgi:UPF0271 protein